MATSAELVVRKPNPMDPASDTPLHEQMYECAGLPYEILIPHDIGPESFEEQNKFAEKPKDEQMAIQYQREEYLKEHVPMGPYPVYTKGQGWALLFLEEEETYPSYVESGDSKLDIEFAGKAAKVTATIRQEIWDNEAQQLIMSSNQWRVKYSKKQLYDIICGEKDNWPQYKKAYEKIVEKAKTKTAALTMSAFGKIHNKQRRSSPRTHKKKRVGTAAVMAQKRTVKRKIFKDAQQNPAKKKSKKLQNVPKNVPNVSKKKLQQ